MRLEPGARLGPYEVVALLGAGGMAEVYRARDVRLGREVAVKVVSEELGTDETFVERFEREARLVGSVNHPNVVALHDVGVHDGKPFFVTELLQGEPLRTRLGKGPVPLPTALAWASQMAEGLAAAHERGIVHRDLKPENVLITRDGHVKLLDFGIAKVIAAAHEPSVTSDTSPRDLLSETVASGGVKTGTGIVIGTPGYMSPEQVRGDPVDARTDLFSLGAVLYELLSGRRAFPGASAVESGYAILHHDPEPLPATVPPNVAQVVHRCLEKDPGHRFQSARDLAFHLEALRVPTASTTPTIASPAPRGRRWWIWVTMALGLVALAAVIRAVDAGWRVGPSLGKRAGTDSSGALRAGVTPSIAVLPFVNLSSDKEQEYFSDGVTEELLDALARVKGLKVAGRTSSFQFKGKNQDARTIGEALGVANIVEGSVRKQGNRVRITAQLIQAEDGFHRWSHTFEGDLTNVFDLQERIARAITDELRVVLQGEQRERLVPVATKNPEAHALYLQASAIFTRREGTRFPDGIAQLEQALQLDPNYARAWSRIGAMRVLMPVYRPADLNAAHDEAEKAAHRAIELDPSLAEPQAVLALAFEERRQYVKSKAAFLRALELEPDDVTANFWFASSLMCKGRIREGNAMLDRLLTIDPMYPNALHWRGIGAFSDGDLDLAERLTRRARDVGLAHAGIGLSYVAEARGQRGEALVQLSSALSALGQGLPAGVAEEIASGALGDVRARDQALGKIERYLSTHGSGMSGVVPYGLIRLGRPREGLELLARNLTGNDALVLPLFWTPYGRAVRTLPEFPDAARRIGLVEFWDHHGPPDMCRRVEPGKYVCR